MDATTKYVRQRVEVASTLNYHSERVDKYIGHLHSIEHLLINGWHSFAGSMAAHWLKSQYPIDWRLIKRELEENGW